MKSRAQQAISELTGHPPVKLREEKLAFSTAVRNVQLIGDDSEDYDVQYGKVDWTAALSGSRSGITDVSLEIVSVDVGYLKLNGENEEEANVHYPSPGWTVELEDVSDGLPLQPESLLVDVARKVVVVQFIQRTER